MCFGVVCHGYFVYTTARLGCNYGAGGVGWSDRIPSGLSPPSQSDGIFLSMIDIQLSGVYIPNPSSKSIRIRLACYICPFVNLPLILVLHFPISTCTFWEVDLGSSTQENNDLGSSAFPLHQSLLYLYQVPTCSLSCPVH